MLKEMRSTSEMNVLERMEFLTMKAEQTLERTANITEYRQFLISPEAMDLFDATVLRVQVVGEMLKQIDDKTERMLLRPNYPEIPWKSVFGLRNFISHEYSLVDPREIFTIVKQDLPQLIAVLRRIITDLRSGRYDDNFQVAW